MNCNPIVNWQDARRGDCHLNLICQRCKRCTRHCVCPPPEMREQPGRRVK